jgi:stage V sporulation protein B
MKRHPNLINFFYLVGSGLLVQLAGTCYRIWLARRVGSEGLGILQMVYPVYRLLSGMATIGLPMALIKWVSEYLSLKDYGRIIELRSQAVKIVTGTSLVIMSLLLANAPLLARHVFTDFRVQEALYIVALAIPFSALSAILRGYFQGLSRMAPTACSEITEQCAEITTTVLVIVVAAAWFPVSIYAAPVLGLTLGEVACLATLILFLNRHRALPKWDQVPAANLPRTEILRYSWPLLLNQIVTSISLASEGVIIPYFLIQAGYSVFDSTGLFGKLTGMAEPVAYFPLIFIGPLATVLSPQISSDAKTNRLRKIHRKILLFYGASLAICLAGFVLILTGAPWLSRLLYDDLSPVYLIRLAVIGLPFTGVAILNIAILASIGKTDKVLSLSLWSTGLKTGLLVFLTPLLGINGSAWAFNIAQIFIALASLAELRHSWPEPVPKICPRSLRPFRFLRQHP